MTADDGAQCCTDECCGPGSWCCARANKHEHPEEGQHYSEAACEDCDGGLYLDQETSVWRHVNAEHDDHDGEPKLCEYIVTPGSPNPDSPSFGPNELCGDVALVCASRCRKHQEEE